MGLFDKLKGAVQAVTGGAATVTIEYPQALLLPGQPLRVRVTATSKGREVKSGGCFIDVAGTETAQVRNAMPTGYHGSEPGQKVPVDASDSGETFHQAFQIAPAFVLGSNETKVFEGAFQLPPGVQPSFQGKLCSHAWTLRGRIEAFGNDPDSGYLPFRVGLAQ
ncbi:MAG: hypothetical protein HY905_18795 [Deltaproteobacteria bacterium]|nr:hypothetical protein [Deltaproteobacteria bacterium]